MKLELKPKSNTVSFLSLENGDVFRVSEKHTYMKVAPYGTSIINCVNLCDGKCAHWDSSTRVMPISGTFIED